MSPIYASMMEKRDNVPKVRAKVWYLMRDTRKETRVTENGLSPATVMRRWWENDSFMKLLHFLFPLRVILTCFMAVSF